LTHICVIFDGTIFLAALTLADYAPLIEQLPYLDQAFETKRSNWERDYRRTDEFRFFCDQAFDADIIKISRADLFDLTATGSPNAIFSIIFWGYPRNMRGNSFSAILASIGLLRQAIRYRQILAQDDFMYLMAELAGSGVV